MLIARVIGDIVATRKKGTYRPRKSVMLQPLNLDSTNKGEAMIALDAVDVKVGDCVLVVKAVGRPESPIDMAVVGIVDRIDLFPGAAGAKDK
jgi:microcompartment protein CcmK/EutM